VRFAFLALLAALLLPIGGAPAKSACPLDLSCTEDARVAHDEALALASKYGADAVLVVVDIDSTLLEMDQYLGSWAWFDWQADLLRRDPTSAALVSNSFEGLLAAQGLLHALSQMHPTERDLPALVENLQNRGIRLIALTSRGFDVRDATRRELLRNGYDLGRNPIPPRPGFLGDDPFLPYPQGYPEAIGLSTTEADQFGLRKPRAVSYRNGLFMTAGQHKGAMLRSLLARTGRDFRAIVFLDDQPRNVRAMAEAYPEESGTQLHAYVYTREGPWHAAADSARSRLAAVSAWNRLAKTLTEVFPSRRGVSGVLPAWGSLPENPPFPQVDR